MAAATVAALVLSLLVIAQPAQAQQGGFRISGRNLVDANGNTFVMRGTSHAHVWYQSQTSSFANISNLGANTVRVVLGSGQRWGPNSASDVQNVINLCKQNRLICMLEVHDTTGFGDEGAAATLDQAVTYWNSIRNVLIGQEAYVLINIGNEPIGNNNAAQWTTATVNAVQRMRTLGFTHTLVVDAPNWGQDWQNVMRSNAQTVWNADSQRNTLFSVHMYEVYTSGSTVTGYFDAFQQMNLPLIVGEFGHVHGGQNVAYQTIMQQAQQRGIGWIAWSWSGNGSPNEVLDQTNNFNPNSLTPWGQIVFTGANGIQQTAQRASVYGDTQPPPGGTLVGAPSGRCLDVPNMSQVNGTEVQLWDCWGGSNQQWTLTSSGQLRVYGNKCLDAEGNGTSPGTRAIIWDCHSGANQRWNVNGNGTITGVQSGLCLDADGAGTANGTRVILWTCHGGSNQHWSLS
jgi:mannan endo-1,4-beta-mannosidase